jgi:hypothetical protein
MTLVTFPMNHIVPKMHNNFQLRIAQSGQLPHECGIDSQQQRAALAFTSTCCSLAVQRTAVRLQWRGLHQQKSGLES